MSRRQHINSLAAYHEGRTDCFNRRETEILKVVARLTRATDRAIRDALGFADMNAVRPRITELIDAGVLREVGTTLDHATEKSVRQVAFCDYDPQLNLSMEGAA